MRVLRISLVLALLASASAAHGGLSGSAAFHPGWESTGAMQDIVLKVKKDSGGYIINDDEVQNDLKTCVRNVGFEPLPGAQTHGMRFREAEIYVTADGFDSSHDLSYSIDLDKDIAGMSAIANASFLGQYHNELRSITFEWNTFTQVLDQDADLSVLDPEATNDHKFSDQLSGNDAMPHTSANTNPYNVAWGPSNPVGGRTSLKLSVKVGYGGTWTGLNQVPQEDVVYHTVGLTVPQNPSGFPARLDVQTFIAIESVP